MTDYKTTLQKLHTNLNTLREREAKHAGNAPLDLLNQIADHEKAIALTKQAIGGEITKAEWRDALKPLLVSLPDEARAIINAQQIGIIGDHAHVEGGIHFHTARPSSTVFDQRGQQVGTQVNVAGDLNIQQPPARIGNTIPKVGSGNEDLSMRLIAWIESNIAVAGPYLGKKFYTFTATPGMKFVILEFEFRNNWVREQVTPSLGTGELRTGKGYFYKVWSPPVGIHSKEYAPRPSTQEEVRTLGKSGAFEPLLPEESVRGHVVFKVPEDEKPEEVNLSQVPVPIELD
jgi:hypothetical protein